MAVGRPFHCGFVCIKRPPLSSEFCEKRGEKILTFIQKFFGKAPAKEVSGQQKGPEQHLLREVEKNELIRKAQIEIVIQHLNNEINLNKTGNELTADGKKDLGINPRLQITHKLLAVLNEKGRAQNDPKSIWSSIAMKANFARSHDENIHNYKSMGLKEYEVVACWDQRDCSWCKSMNGKKLSVNQSINELIEQNCKCDSHCRLVTVAVLD
ncbi:hypothetical protein [Salinivibrio sp. YCSC6]|uniref:hypothetical protein n=1 Tax=Salinivibrio sp. YCSC6 TaxID=2003370 RepID=UPI000BBBCD8F|nr:hypothetical protein [Salinivibrio sp. YCSC6]PCE67980.1 hypothetical protein B6G00_06550 [Salinivibrio sp. YCSC6]QCF35124.1 hypothetical protein E8E00_02430 [Salinivibrio sp. YCSC6]